MLSNETLGGTIEMGMRVRIFCENPDCLHDAPVDIHALAERLGPDHGALAKDLIPLFKCSKCGSKHLSLRTWPADTATMQPWP